MSEDKLTELRSKHAYLEDLSNEQLIDGGFTFVPDLLMPSHYEAWQNVQAMPEEQRKEIRASALGKVLDFGPPEKQPVAPEAQVEPEVDATDITLSNSASDYFEPVFQDSLTSSLDFLERAERGEITTPDEIDAHQRNINENLSSSNILDTSKAYAKSAGNLAISALGLLEPLTYPQRLLFYGFGEAGQLLPDSQTISGDFLKEASGEVGSAIETVLGNPLDPDSYLYREPLYGAAYNTAVEVGEQIAELKRRAEEAEKPDENYTGIGETLFENLYDSVSSGAFSDLAKKSHFNIVPTVDATNVPYISSIDVGNQVLPKETLQRLSKEAEAAGKKELAQDIQRLATDDFYRSIVFMLPEIVLDPLWFFGPAKGGQVFYYGGKAVQMSEAGVKAARAVTKVDSLVVDLKSAQKLVSEAALGDNQALGKLDSMADTLATQSERALDLAKDAGKAAAEADSRQAALQFVTKQIEDQAKGIELIIEDANKIIASPQSSQRAVAKAQQTLEVLSKSSEEGLNKLRTLAETVGQDKAEASKILTGLSKRRFAQSRIFSQGAEDVRFVTQSIENGMDAQKVARINRGYNFHIPFTQKAVNVGLPAYTNGLKIKPLPGDDLVSISNRIGVDEMDLARLNGIKGPADEALPVLEKMIQDQKPIIFQLGKKGISGGDIAKSFIPGGLAYNYTKGIFKEPLIRVLETAGIPRNVTSPANIQRIRNLDAGQLSNSDRITKFIFDNKPSLIYSRGEDAVLKILGSRWVRPIVAAEKLQEAMRYYADRGVTTIRKAMTPNETAIIKLVNAPDGIWNAYTTATRQLLRLQRGYSNEINQFMNQISADLQRVATNKTKALGTEVTPLQVMQDVINAIESGTANKLTTSERALRDEINGLVQRIAQDRQVQDAEERVRQSLIAMVRYLDTAAVDQKVATLRRYHELLELTRPAQKEVTKQVRSRLANRMAALQKKLGKKGSKALKAEIKAIKEIREALNNRKLAQSAEESMSVLAAKDRDAIIKVEARIKDQVDELEEIVEAGIPEIVIKAPEETFPVGGSQNVFNRRLLNWEEELFTEFNGILAKLNQQRIAQDLEPMTEAAVLRGVFAIMGETPSARKDPDAFRQLADRYSRLNNSRTAAVEPPPEVTERIQVIQDELDSLVMMPNRTPQQNTRLSQLRFAEDLLDPELEAIRTSIVQMFAKYEDLYKSRGMDFVKNPVDRMKIWGAIDYFPHMRKDSLNPITVSFDQFKNAQSRRKILDSFQDVSRGSLDRQLFLDTPVARRRTIIGTIEEINALPRGNRTSNWEFSASPISMAAQFQTGSKAITNRDMISTFLKSGVIRQFNTLGEAAAKQYVPLFDNGNFTAEMQILMGGNKNAIDELIAASGDEATDILFKFRQKITEAQESGKRIGAADRPFKSWSSDIREINDIDSVEQAVSGLNLFRARQGQDTFDIRTMFETRMRTAIEAEQAKLNVKVADLRKGLEAAKKASKKEKILERIEKLERRLVQDTEEYNRLVQTAEKNAWNSISSEINQAVAVANNPTNKALKVTTEFGRLPNVSAKSLKTYFAKDQEIFRLYMPAQVQESLSRVFADVGPTSALGMYSKKAFDAVNNFWKSRITVLSLAFTTRNVVGNVFSNVLDIGVGGALSLDTNVKAWAIGSLVDYYAKYGSITKAQEILSQPIITRGPGGITVRDRFRAGSGYNRADVAAREKLDLGALEFAMKVFGKDVKNGESLIDLGDGVLRSLDNVLSDLSKRGVISGDANYRVDADQVMYQYEKLARDMGIQEATGQVQKAGPVQTLSTLGSGVEDIVYIGVPYIVGAPGLAVPKWLGNTIARRAENQGRMVNFIANVKRGKTTEEAVEQVNKYLFDYGDLTQWQKVWVRSIIPFFTWNQKNVLLHLEMINKNPQYYNSFYKSFYLAMPELVESYKREQLEQKTGLEFPEYRGTDLQAERIMKNPMYKAYRITVPLPEDNMYISGFGLPLESFAQNVGTAQAIMLALFESYKTAFGETGTPRTDNIEYFAPYFAQTHVLFRAAIELGMDVDVFRGQSIRDSDRPNDIKDQYLMANEIGNLVHELMNEYNPELQAETPEDVARFIKQGKGPWMAQYIMDTLDIQVIKDHEKNVQHYYVPVDKLNALRALKMYPGERLIREAATVNDLNQTMMLTPEAKLEGKPAITPKGMAGWRTLTTFSGIRIKQDLSDNEMRDRFERSIEQMKLDYQTKPIKD